MIPSGYKEDVVYSQIPTNGNGDLSFTRASNGTRVNSAGLVEVCPWNMLQQSETFDNAAWVKQTDTTISSNATTSPDGNTNADKLINSTSVNRQAIYQNSSLTGVVSFSVFAKKAEYDVIQLTDGRVPTAFANFDLTNGVLGSVNNYNATITSVGSGWYRCSISYDYGADTINQPRISLAQTTTEGRLVEFAGSGTDGAFIWGAQLNIGSTAKPYFPTTDRLNVPRLTYQNGGGGCPSLLLEKQSTNLVSYSEQLDNAAWNKEQLSVTANTTTSPDGTQNADSMTENTANDHHLIYQGFTLSAGAYTESVFMKKNTRQYGFLQIATDTAVNRYTIVVDLDNGSVTATSTAGSPTGTSYKIDSMGNGWYRVTATATHTAGDVYCVFGLSNSANPTFSAVATPTYTGNGTGSIYVWGAQLEASSYATSYIPTTSSSATRVADDITNTFLQSGGFLGSNTGAMFVSGTTYSLGNTILNFVLTADNNTTKAFLFDTISNQIRLRTWDASSNTQSLTSGTITGNYKLCVSWTSSSIKYFVNGSLIGTISQTTYPYTTIKPESTSYSNNIWGEVVFFPTNIADADAIALTT